MFESEQLARVRAAESACRAAVAAVADPDGIPASQAVVLYETLERAGRAVAAAKTLLARRVGDSQAWRRAGHSSAAEHLAAISGRSLGSARSELETSGALSGLADTKRALVDGELSEAQGQMIADAASVNPGAERDLISQAASTNHRGLRDAAARAKAAADSDPDATHRRVHSQRRVSHGPNLDGSWGLRGTGTVVDGSVIAAELDRLTDEVFAVKGAAGIRECRDAYQFDALVEMARRSQGLRGGDRASGPVEGHQPRKLNAPQHLALLRLDISALQRGYTQGEELCEIAGLGPIPVSAARRLLGDAALKVVITRGVDVLNVTSLTRGPTQAMRYAALWSSPVCTVRGCTKSRVQYDHRWGREYKDTRHTRLDELDPLCHHHHELHTRHGWALVAGKGDRPIVAPDHPHHPANAPPGTDPPLGETQHRDPPPADHPSLFAQAAP